MMPRTYAQYVEFFEFNCSINNEMLMIFKLIQSYIDSSIFVQCSDTYGAEDLLLNIMLNVVLTSG